MSDPLATLLSSKQKKGAKRGKKSRKHSRNINRAKNKRYKLLRIDLSNKKRKLKRHLAQQPGDGVARAAWDTNGFTK